MHTCPKFRCALQGSGRAQSCTPKARGEILTFHHPALDSPKSCGTVLPSSPLKGCKVSRCLGEAQGTPHSSTHPVCSPSARGRPASRCYKNEPALLKDFWILKKLNLNEEAQTVEKLASVALYTLSRLPYLSTQKLIRKGDLTLSQEKERRVKGQLGRNQSA